MDDHRPVVPSNTISWVLFIFKTRWLLLHQLTNPNFHKVVRYITALFQKWQNCSVISELNNMIIWIETSPRVCVQSEQNRWTDAALWCTNRGEKVAQSAAFPTLRSFSIISSMLMSPFCETLLSMLVSHSQSSLYFSLNTVHSFSFSLTCCRLRDSYETQRQTSGEEHHFACQNDRKLSRVSQGSSHRERRLRHERVICIKQWMPFPVCMHFFQPYTGCCGQDDFEREVLCVREIGTHNMPATLRVHFSIIFFLLCFCVFIIFISWNYTTLKRFTLHLKEDMITSHLH